MITQNVSSSWCSETFYSLFNAQFGINDVTKISLVFENYFFETGTFLSVCIMLFVTCIILLNSMNWGDIIHCKWRLLYNGFMPLVFTGAVYYCLYDHFEFSFSNMNYLKHILVSKNYLSHSLLFQFWPFVTTLL